MARNICAMNRCVTVVRALALMAAMVGGSAVSAAAIPITVAWDRNPESDVVSYRVSYGTSSGIYTASVDAGNNTSVLVDGLTRGTRYYYVVQAINASGQISDPSVEVSDVVPVFPPQPALFYSTTTGAWSAPMTDAANPGAAPAVAPGWLVRE